MNEEAVKEFLADALLRIPHGKLKKRIANELTEHIEDAYHVYIDGGLSDADAAQKAVEEMGNADEIGYQLYCAHKSRIVFIRMFRVVISITIVFALLITVPPVCSEVFVYFNASTIAESEENISRQYNNGEEIMLLGEYEYDGVVTRVYLPKTPSSDDGCKYFYTRSIKFFNISIPEKTGANGGGSNRGNTAILTLTGENGQFNSQSQINIFFENPGYKYIRVWIDNWDTNSLPDGSPTGEWSEYYEVPSEFPGVMRIDVPKGKHWSYYRLYDENKQKTEHRNSPKNQSTVAFSEVIN